MNAIVTLLARTALGATEVATSQPAATTQPGGGGELAGAESTGYFVELLEKWPWLKYEVFTGVSLSKIIVAFVLILAALVIGKIVRTAIEGYAARLEKADRRTLLRLFLRCMAKPLYVVVFGYGVGLALVVLLANVEAFRSYGMKIGTAVVYLGFGWFIYNLVDIAEHYLNQVVKRTGTGLDDQLVPLLRKSLRVVIIILVALFVAQNVFQADIGAMLAGLGIGGLAVALAAQDSIANFFGSITIFADRPFVLGERVKIDGADGTVEEVGFRSSKIRTLDGHLVTIPNSKVANTLIENVSRRPFIRRLTNLTVTYDTPPEKVERAVELVKGVLAARDDIQDDFVVVFNEFNDWSLNVLMVYKVATTDFPAALAVHQQVNLAIMRAFAAEKIEFAFPTHTAYHKTEAPLLVRETGGEAGEN